MEKKTNKSPPERFQKAKTKWRPFLWCHGLAKRTEKRMYATSTFISRYAKTEWSCCLSLCKNKTEVFSLAKTKEHANSAWRETHPKLCHGNERWSWVCEWGLLSEWRHGWILIDEWYFGIECTRNSKRGWIKIFVMKIRAMGNWISASWCVWVSGE